jgi:hypothetical protein
MMVRRVAEYDTEVDDRWLRTFLEMWNVGSSVAAGLHEPRLPWDKRIGIVNGDRDEGGCNSKLR